MMKAIWNNQVIAESNDTVVVEENHYFPEDAAWYYPEPKEAAKQIKSRVAFWRGITIEK